MLLRLVAIRLLGRGQFLDGLEAAVDFGLISKEPRLDKAVVKEIGTMELRQEAPEEKQNLEEVIERDPEEEEVREGFDQLEEAVHHPVGESLRVIGLVTRLQRLETRIQRVDKPHQVAKGSGTKPEQYERQEECDETQYNV